MIGAAAGLTRGLTSCAPPEEQAAARPLSAAEAGRLAAMRLHNYEDGVVGVRATIGEPGAQSHLSGWVDWRRPLVYLAVSGSAEGLVQAIPGVIAVRQVGAGRTPTPAPAEPPPEPPAEPPADGWQVRRLVLGGPGASALDSFVGLLFTIAAAKPDTPDLLVRSESRWLRRDLAAGVPVDVLLGPAVPPSARPTPAGTRAPFGPVARPSRTVSPSTATAPATTPTVAATSLAAMGGAVVYWLDAGARLRRFEALLDANLPVTADLQRESRVVLTAIDLLGGRPIAPRAVTADEARTLARLRQRDRAARGGEVSLTVPTDTGGLQRGAGWLDWRTAVAYLGIDDGGGRVLVRADRDGVATRPAPPGGHQPGDLPPLPLPRDEEWRFASWEERGDTMGGFDLDLLLGEALALSGLSRDDTNALRRTAVWLRADKVAAGDPVAVYEIPKPVEKGVPRGGARLRYWVDEAGVLRRLELRTRNGAFGWLDLDPGEVPTLRRVPLA